jgi:phage terminase large subunit-like protein
MLSVVPSSAGIGSLWTISLPSTPATGTIGAESKAVIKTSYVADAAGDLATTGCQFFAVPEASSKNNAALTLASGATATYVNTNSTWQGPYAADAWNAYLPSVQTNASGGGRSTGYTTVAFTPDKAGSYQVRCFVEANTVSRTIYADWSITVAAKAAANTTASTAVTSPAGTGSGTDVDGIYAPKAAAAAVATILVTAVNGSTTAPLANSDALSKTATISGPGLISWDAGVTKGRTVASAAGTLAQTLSVYGDGAAGVATITISDSSAQFTKTKTVTFYGAVASYVLTVKNSAISVGSAADTQVLTVAAKDSNGVEVPNSTVYVSSSSTATATVDSATVATAADATAADIGVNGVATGAAVITVANASSAATVSATATVNIVKAGIASVVLSFDKAEYSAGEKATITITAKNSDGVLAGDETYATLFAVGGITSSASLAADVSSVSKTLTNGVATYTVYMPLAVGPVTISAKLGASVATAIQDTVVTATAPVRSDGVAEAAQAAAEEATAAANDATDAALSAAEAAEAATAMAQEAVDAVAELSAQVTTLISALRAQITSLTNLVIKIQKKVKA